MTTLRLFVVGALLTVLAACSADTVDRSDVMEDGRIMGDGRGELEADAAPGDLPVPDRIAPEDAAVDRTGSETGPNEKCSILPDLTGRSFRVWEMFATEPTELINEFWAEGVKDYTIVILFHVVKHDVHACEMDMLVSTAWADKVKNDDGTYTPLEYRYAQDPALLRVALNGLDIELIEELDLTLMSETVSKPIFIEGLVGGGSFSEDGKNMEELNLSGYITEESTFGLCLNFPVIGPANMHWFMTTGGICPKADLDEDGKPDAYNFKGVVRAVDESDLFKPGIHPIESLIEECPYHDEQCTD